MSVLENPDNQRVLQRLLQSARVRGFLTWDEFNEAIPPQADVLPLIEECADLFQRLGLRVIEPGEFALNRVQRQEKTPEPLPQEESDPVRIYAAQLRSHPPLPAEKETTLLQERAALFFETAREIARAPAAPAWWRDTLGAVAAGTARGDRWFSTLPPRDERREIAAAWLKRVLALENSDALFREMGLRYDWLASFVTRHPEETRCAELFERLERKNDRLIESHLRLAASLASPKTGRGIPFLDLVQEANLALTRAARRLPPEFDGDFSSRASHLIRQALATLTARQSGLSRSEKKELGAWKKTRDDLTVQNHEQPSWETLADHVGATPETVRQRFNQHRETSLDEPVSPHSHETKAETLPDPTPPVDHEQRSLMEEALQSLSDREREVLMRRVGWNDTPVQSAREIADALGLSESRVHQIEARAIRKLRHPSILARMDFL